jgi:SNF2 family DNA or RNA helicase
MTNWQPRAKKYLLIYTDDEKLKEWDQQDVARAGEALLAAKPFETPASLRAEVGLKPHQLQGIQWLQNCHRLRSESRRGSLLADDMGLGKTLQILAYLAWCIETDPDLGLSSPAAP